MQSGKKRRLGKGKAWQENSRNKARNKKTSYGKVRHEQGMNRARHEHIQNWTRQCKELWLW